MQIRDAIQIGVRRRGARVFHALATLLCLGVLTLAACERKASTADPVTEVDVSQQRSLQNEGPETPGGPGATLDEGGQERAPSAAPGSTARPASKGPDSEDTVKKDDKKLAAESAAGGDDLCNAIVGARYESVKLEECGPPVNGQPAPMCPSEIKFENGEYHWRVTDMVFFGPYSCKGDTIKGSGSGDLVARIGAKAATLTIKGELYKRK